jgi:hypothetical protein
MSRISQGTELPQILPTHDGTEADMPGRRRLTPWLLGSGLLLLFLGVWFLSSGSHTRPARGMRGAAGLARKSPVPLSARPTPTGHGQKRSCRSEAVWPAERDAV